MSKEYKYISDEEYEIVPVTPLRKLEKKIEMLEKSRSDEIFNRVLDKLIDLTEINQRIVEEMVRSNQGLREDIEILVAKMNTLEDKMNDFVDILRNIAEAELKEAESKFDPDIIAKTISESINNSISSVFSEIGKKLENLVNKMNDENKNLIQVLIAMDKKLRRLSSSPQNNAINATQHNTIFPKTIQSNQSIHQVPSAKINDKVEFEKKRESINLPLSHNLHALRNPTLKNIVK